LTVIYDFGNLNLRFFMFFESGGCVLKNTRIDRMLDLDTPLGRRSVFLFGPRQTGKTTYLEHQMKTTPALKISLLDSALFRELTAKPETLRFMVEGQDLRDATIVIDEIQRCPALLDEIQTLIEERQIRFLLTGSSARKLRAAGVNLLGGRALRRELHPLTYWELGEQFNLDRSFHAGLLPSIYLGDGVDDDLQAYIGQYLREEIAAEGLARNLSAFSRFLELAAACHGQQINFTSIAGDVGVSRVTIQSYFQILVDTLLGDFLNPLHLSGKVKTVSTPKFYFFDAGVVRATRRLKLIQEGTLEYGTFFEHLVYHHLRCFVSYKKRDSTLHFWRTQKGEEVDFVLDNEIAIECKATANVSEKHLHGLKSIANAYRMRRLILVCRVAHPLRIGEIEVLPLANFLDQLWAGL
jgi:predicted AAA+ superfamily ATPase